MGKGTGDTEIEGIFELRRRSGRRKENAKEGPFEAGEEEEMRGRDRLRGLGKRRTGSTKRGHLRGGKKENVEEGPFEAGREE